MPVEIVNRQKRGVDRRGLTRLAQAVLRAEGCPAQTELSVVIGDDEWIRELNRRYLKKDAPTDVLAFPEEPSLGDSGPPQEVSGRRLGEVAISGETAARQARQLGHGFEEELAILLAHGILHLTGWRDETPALRRRMMRRVKEVLAQARQGLEP